MDWRHLPSIEDDIKGVSTYELADGRRVCVSNHMVRELGVAECLFRLGVAPKPSSLPRKTVFWEGRAIGTVPGSFDPRNVRSAHWLYDPRPGDFVPDGDGWRASSKLGPGDIEAVDGFQRSPPPPSEG